MKELLEELLRLYKSPAFRGYAGLCLTTIKLKELGLISPREAVILNDYLRKKIKEGSAFDRFFYDKKVIRSTLECSGYWWPKEDSKARINFLEYLISKEK